ncbi:MAG TPA: LCP family protein [Candidatus Limnocylindria bacterium]
MQRSQARRQGWGAGAVIALVVVLAIIAAILAFVLLNQQQPGASPSIGPSAETPIPTPGETLNADLLGQRLTVLVIGLDTSEERRNQGLGLNTDSLMLASVSADQSEVTLISLPRDTVDIPLPDGTTWTSKVNAIYAERDVDTLVGAMQELFGVPIDGYVAVDMDDLVQLVDAAGGVTVDPAQPLVDPKVHLDLPAGQQELDGPTALAYVRTRIDTDYGRAARQQEVLLDLVARLSDSQTDVDLRDLLSGLASLDTDLPLDDLPTLLEIARRAQAAEVTRQVLQPPEFIPFEGDAGDGRGYILEPDVEAIRDYAARTIGQE